MQLKTSLVLIFQTGVVIAFVAALLQGLGWMQDPSTAGSIPGMDPFGFFWLPLATGLVYLVTGLYVFKLRQSDPAGRAFATFSAATAISIFGIFDAMSTQALVFWWRLGIVIAAGTLFELALIFPQHLQVVTQKPWLKAVVYLPGGILVAAGLPALGVSIRPAIWTLEYILLVAGLLAFIAASFYRIGHTTSPIVREQARFILLGSTVSFVPSLAWLLINLARPLGMYSPLLMIPLVFFPLSGAYALLRYRLANADLLLSRGLGYSLLTILATTAYGLLVSGVSLIAGDTILPSHPVVVGLWVFLLVILFNPLRSRLQAAIDANFFRGEEIYRSRLQSFSRELTQVMALPEILGLMQRHIRECLSPDPLHLFVYDPLIDLYVASPGGEGQTSSDVQFASDSGLIRCLSSLRGSLFIDRETSLPAELQADRPRLALLGCSLFVPMRGRERLAGWLALGERLSGELYSTPAVEFLEGLSDQASLAIERAQVVADLERRVRELDVFTRVAQGINFTIAFDDILELIYTQTNQIIPTRDFHITLFDRQSESLHTTFWLEDDERLRERENSIVPPGQGLDYEVIACHHTLITDDYEWECRNRGLQPGEKGIFSWMGAPMFAGGEVIGVISTGCRNAAVIYTEEQGKLFQAITDQAAGAIIKARLLQESEQRAHQLSTLNEIGRGLTSTLELKPLLKKILQAATEMLNCEAGSLFLVDENTGELVFEVVIGPVAADLVGKRLPPGRGLVGEAVENRRAIIANDAKRRKEWFAKTDAQTGFSTQDLLVVPMQVKDRVIGVIEVINKADGLPFTESDQDLLITFSSQATIAIENARLYMLTDQALAARVEELSAMQRIDRELNATLDVQRALHITLEWAMRQSRADAGLVGMVAGERVRVMAQAGYPELFSLPDANDTVIRDLNSQEGSLLPEGLDVVRQVLATGQPQQLTEKENGEGGLLQEANSRLGIPIRRESTVIGVLLLESLRSEGWSKEDLAYLTRLADHAAIAISNAQLYTEVQSANLAKSKFVSFVAHELKNPMASIKGYTELVASGMAGPVTEMQGSFLNTVRSNVDRMNTIVSDLNDLTKIQVGSLRLEFKAVALQQVVQDAAGSMKRQFQEKELALDIRVPNDLPKVWGDPVRLHQIVTNLLSNANKYTKSGGRVEIGAERTTQGSQNGNAAANIEVVHVWVKDNGIGISEEDQEKIFQQYFRTEISKETASGTGLGLNITRSLVEMQGGQIWFESELDKGTTLHFTAPVAEAS